MSTTLSAFTAAPALPTARGPLGAALLDTLRRPPRTDSVLAAPAGLDPWGEDLQLALYTCYELHYLGFAGVHAAWEWHPALLALRAQLEHAFLGALCEAVGDPPPLDRALSDLLVEPAGADGPSYRLLADGQRWQAREFLVHRSLYHLKEADPQLWVVPRLPHPVKGALMTIQFDEYGAGRPERAHAVLFAEMMADFGLDPAYGHYLDAVPAPGLAAVNLQSMFGLHRSLRAALIGQFATLEITSSPGAARLAQAFAQLGASPAGTLFYREHITADAVHEQLVRHTVIAPLVAAEPELAAGIAFGIAATGAVEERLGGHLLGCWNGRRSSLRVPLDDAPGATAGVDGVDGVAR
ncbi:iron-containing redox enzyme family protein [Kitasatospora sp. NBC_01250]|uniref:iron-containing redox enzyme family protein n=1 Tax=Kitasatospora sp. NBC_01250 TaxID=2903571 RepID=UPI002E34234A|nr:iron-containing redox enzyme family protein [Kitasatospora sp. NBC_01250]